MGVDLLTARLGWEVNLQGEPLFSLPFATAELRDPSAEPRPVEGRTENGVHSTYADVQSRVQVVTSNCPWSSLPQASTLPSNVIIIV